MTLLLDPEPWRAEAACRKVSHDLFFQDEEVHGSSLEAVRRQELARAVCNVCTVRQECLDYALSFSSSADFGVWGGTTKLERDRMRGLRRKKRPPSSCRLCGRRFVPDTKEVYCSESCRTEGRLRYWRRRKREAVGKNA